MFRWKGSENSAFFVFFKFCWVKPVKCQEFLCLPQLTKPAVTQMIKPIPLTDYFECVQNVFKNNSKTKEATKDCWKGKNRKIFWGIFCISSGAVSASWCCSIHSHIYTHTLIHWWQSSRVGLIRHTEAEAAQGLTQWPSYLTWVQWHHEILPERDFRCQRAGKTSFSWILQDWQQTAWHSQC